MNELILFLYKESFKLLTYSIYEIKQFQHLDADGVCFIYLFRKFLFFLFCKGNENCSSFCYYYFQYKWQFVIFFTRRPTTIFSLIGKNENVNMCFIIENGSFFVSAVKQNQFSNPHLLMHWWYYVIYQIIILSRHIKFLFQPMGIWNALYVHWFQFSHLFKSRLCKNITCQQNIKMVEFGNKKYYFIIFVKLWYNGFFIIDTLSSKFFCLRKNCQKQLFEDGTRDLGESNEEFGQQFEEISEG